MHFLPDHVFDYGRKAWRESPKKRRDALKRAILTKKSKIFIKAKLTVSKSCLLGHLGFMIFCILRGDILQIAFEKMKLFKMHRIIKLTCPSRQLFIKITFAFMKIFDFLVKIAIFGAFLFRSRDSCHALLPRSSVGFGQ